MNATAAPSPSSSPGAAGTGAWGPFDSKGAFFTNVVATAVGVACVVLIAFSVYVALRCRAKRRRGKAPAAA